MLDIFITILSFIYASCIHIAIGISIALAIYYVGLLVRHVSTKAGKHGKENMGS